MSKTRTIKCKIERTNFGPYAVHVYASDGIGSSYYYLASHAAILVNSTYYNVEKRVPNTEIFRKLYPDAIENGQFLIIRELKLD